MTKSTAATAILVALVALLFVAHRHTSRRVDTLERELADRQQREREKGQRLINTPRDEPPDGHRAVLRLLPGGAAAPPLPLRRKP